MSIRNSRCVASATSSKASKRNRMLRRHKERPLLGLSSRNGNRGTPWLRHLRGLALLILVFVGHAAGDGSSIKHLGEGPADRILHCIDTATRRHTLVYYDFLGDFAKVGCDPGQGGDQIVKNIEAQGFRVLSNDQWT